MRVAVVGAGAIGSFIASKLAERGSDVVLFDKARDHKKVCSGLISARLWNFIPENKKIVEASFDRIILHFPSKDVELILKQKLLAIDREALNKYIFDLAARAGAEIRIKAIRGISDLKGFDRIIGCDGAFSVVRSALGLQSPHMKLGIIFYSREKSGKDIEAWSTEGGFFWKVPRKRVTEYGVLSEPRSALKLLNEFAREQGLSYEKLYAAHVPCGIVLPKSEKVTLCGDAAGLTKPWSGGGIIWGLTAAEILIADFPDFNKYRIDVYRKFWTRQKLAEHLSWAVPRAAFLLPRRVEMDVDWLV